MKIRIPRAVFQGMGAMIERTDARGRVARALSRDQIRYLAGSRHAGKTTPAVASCRPEGSREA